MLLVFYSLFINVSWDICCVIIRSSWVLSFPPVVVSRAEVREEGIHTLGAEAFRRKKKKFVLVLSVYLSPAGGLNLDSLWVRFYNVGSSSILEWIGSRHIDLQSRPKGIFRLTNPADEFYNPSNMASDMSKFSIPMFDGKMDFTVWKMTIEDVLIQYGINEALEKKQPAEMKDDVWKTMQKKASSTIRLALAPEIKYSMELYSLKLEEGSNLHDHINSFNQLVCQLANVNDAIKDEEQALLMLSSLPKSYKPFVQTMLTGRTTLTFEDVLKALRDNERMTGNDILE
ncbi:hypothetical protein Tco_0847181 [Tanacetum coccineum]